MKSEIIDALVNARKSHLRWLVHADELIKGVDQSEAKKPVECTQCDFGRWYYSRGVKVNNLPVFKKVERIHKEFHKEYSKIYFKRYDRRSAEKPRKLISFLQTTSDTSQPHPDDLTLEECFEVLKQHFQSLHKETKSLEDMVNIMHDKLFTEERF